jgi:hypothetical protein
MADLNHDKKKKRCRKNWVEFTRTHQLLMCHPYHLLMDVSIHETKEYVSLTFSDCAWRAVDNKLSFVPFLCHVDVAGLD